MSGPAFRAAGAPVYSLGSGSVALANPTCSAGDLLVAVFACDSAPSTASGWTSLGGTANCGPWVFTKTATAADSGSSVTWALNNTSGTEAAVLAYSGNPAVDQVAVGSSGFSSPVTAPTVTTTHANEVVIEAWAAAPYSTSNYTGCSGPATQRVASASAHAAVVVSDQAQAATGSSSAQTASFSTTSTGKYGSLTLSIYSLNHAPNAPTLTSPANNATLDRGITQRFAWTFSDPDAGDSQSKYDLQYRTVGGSTWTTVSGTTPNNYWDAAASTFAAGNYEWQVRTYDSQGVVGPWSTSSFFTAADAPAPATITAPTSGATVSSSATLTWSAPNQTDYQWRRIKDNAGSADTGTIYADSGDVVDSTTRSVSLTFDTNNRYEHIQVRIKYNGLWSAWSDIRIQVSYTPPTTPTFTLTPDNTAGSPTQGSILVAITNPAPGAGQPAVSYNDVYVTDPGKSEERRATNVAANGTWRYWTPPDGFDGTTVGHVRVVAVATNGTTAST